tara:strand:+ start:158 stop:601 length:444 start_codon:yes stop_codon:yes gene_type:complete
MTKKIELIDANVSVDDRGELLFCNDFDMSKIKRFYHISNFKTPFVRAWHGHKFEDKYILVSKGAALVAAVKIDDWKKPSKNLNIQTFTLNDKKPKLLFIPGGFAHGYKTFLPDTRLIIFSTSTLSESIKDDYRYDAYYWNPWTIKER